MMPLMKYLEWEQTVVASQLIHTTKPIVKGPTKIYRYPGRVWGIFDQKKPCAPLLFDEKSRYPLIFLWKKSRNNVSAPFILQRISLFNCTIPKIDCFPVRDCVIFLGLRDREILFSGIKKLLGPVHIIVLKSRYLIKMLDQMKVFLSQGNEMNTLIKSVLVTILRVIAMKIYFL